MVGGAGDQGGGWSLGCNVVGGARLQCKGWIKVVGGAMWWVELGIKVVGGVSIQ